MATVTFAGILPAGFPVDGILPGAMPPSDGNVYLKRPKGGPSQLPQYPLWITLSPLPANAPTVKLVGSSKDGTTYSRHLAHATYFSGVINFESTTFAHVCLKSSSGIGIDTFDMPVVGEPDPTIVVPYAISPDKVVVHRARYSPTAWMVYPALILPAQYSVIEALSINSEGVHTERRVVVAPTIASDGFLMPMYWQSDPATPSPKVIAYVPGSSAPAVAKVETLPLSPTYFILPGSVVVPTTQVEDVYKSMCFAVTKLSLESNFAAYPFVAFEAPTDENPMAGAVYGDSTHILDILSDLVEHSTLSPEQIQIINQLPASTITNYNNITVPPSEVNVSGTQVDFSTLIAALNAGGIVSAIRAIKASGSSGDWPDSAIDSLVGIYEMQQSLAEDMTLLTRAVGSMTGPVSALGTMATNSATQSAEDVAGQGRPASSPGALGAPSNSTRTSPGR